VRPPKEVAPPLECQVASKCKALLPCGHGRMSRRSPLSRDPWRVELLPYGQRYICTLIGRHLSLASIICDGHSSADALGDLASFPGRGSDPV
jgi:hypothetical protein